MQSHLALKKILIPEWISDDLYEGIYDKGVFMNHIKMKKKLTASNYTIWQSIQKFRADEFGRDTSLLDDTLLDLTGTVRNSSTGRISLEEDPANPAIELSVANSIPQPGLDKSFNMTQENINPEQNLRVFNHPSGELMVNPQNPDALPGAAKLPHRSSRTIPINPISKKVAENVERKCEREAKNRGISVKTKIEEVIVDGFVANNKKVPYAHLIRIYWMLVNKVVIFHIFEDLKDMLELCTNFKAKFLYFYAMKEMEHYLKNFYTNPELVNLKRKDEVIEMDNYSIPGAETSQSGDGVGILDLGYAFYHKYNIEYMKYLISEFADRNNKFLEDVLMRNCSYKMMHEKVKELNNLDQTIQSTFIKYHRDSKTTEANHILPYCVHLIYNTNLIRSGKNYLAEYMKRTQLANRIREERNPMFLAEHILLDTVMCLVNTEPQSIGNIIDVYGNSLKLLNIDRKSIIGKSPNYLIPESMTVYHTRVMKTYLRSPLRYFLGVQRESLVRIPETRFVISSNLLLKLAPNMESNFKIVVGIKPNQKKYNQKIVLNEDMTVDCFSHNFLQLIGIDYLNQGTHLSQMSPELMVYVTKAILDMDDFKGDINRIKQKRLAQKSIQKIVNQEFETEEENEDGKSNKKHKQPSYFSHSSVDKSLNDGNEGGKINTINVFPITFTNQSTGARIQKIFEVELEAREFIDVGKRMYYLDLTVLDDNDAKITVMRLQNKKLDHIDRTFHNTINEKESREKYATGSYLDRKSSGAKVMENRNYLDSPNLRTFNNQKHHSPQRAGTLPGKGKQAVHIKIMKAPGFAEDEEDMHEVPSEQNRSLDWNYGEELSEFQPQTYRSTGSHGLARGPTDNISHGGTSRRYRFLHKDCETEVYFPMPKVEQLLGDLDPKSTQRSEQIIHNQAKGKREESESKPFILRQRNL